jgi:hypothetical protein
MKNLLILLILPFLSCKEQISTNQTSQSETSYCFGIVREFSEKSQQYDKIINITEVREFKEWNNTIEEEFWDEILKQYQGRNVSMETSLHYTLSSAVKARDSELYKKVSQENHAANNIVTPDAQNKIDDFFNSNIGEKFKIIKEEHYKNGIKDFEMTRKYNEEFTIISRDKLKYGILGSIEIREINYNYDRNGFEITGFLEGQDEWFIDANLEYFEVLDYVFDEEERVSNSKLTDEEITRKSLNDEYSKKKYRYYIEK